MKIKFPLGWLHPTPSKARHVGDSIFAAATSGAIIAFSAASPNLAGIFAGAAFAGKFISLLYVQDDPSKAPELTAAPSKQNEVSASVTTESPADSTAPATGV